MARMAPSLSRAPPTWLPAAGAAPQVLVLVRYAPVRPASEAVAVLPLTSRPPWRPAPLQLMEAK